MKIVKLSYVLLSALVMAWPMTGTAADRKTPTAPDEFLRMTNPIAPSTDALHEAKGIYENRCSKCHGTNGDGNGSATRDLDVKPRNYRDRNLMSTIPDGQLFWIIMNGSDPEATEMAGYKKKLPEDHVWKLIHYIRSFAK